MAHGTRISGTNKDVTAGFTRTSGVNMKITKGLTLVGGVQKEIPFAPTECVITFLDNGNTDYLYALIDGKKYIGDRWTDHDEIVVMSGTVIELYADDYRYGNGIILLDGTTVASADPASYQYTVKGDLEITFEFLSGVKNHVSKIYIATK